MLRGWTFLSLTLISLLPLQALAGNFDFLRTDAGPQKDFYAQVDSGNFHDALLNWDKTYAGTSFAASDSGRATWAYLLYQNGLPLLSLEYLMQNSAPNKVDPALLKLWTVELKNSALIQKGWVVTEGGWKNVVNNARISIRIKTKAEISKAFAAADKIDKGDINEKARVWWQIATQAPLINEADSALKALKLIKESGQSVIGTDLIAMTQGRVLYQKNDLAAALAAYQQIPKNSNLWIESVEERAWTHLRQDDYDSAFGDITTALSPALAPLAGPETFFLANLMAYKVCDYPRVFNNSEMFKKRHKARLLAIQDLAQKGTNAVIGPVFERFDQKGVRTENAGRDIENLPRGLVRDAEFVRMMETRRELLTEAKAVGGLNGVSRLDQFGAAASTEAEHLKQKAALRASQLAKVDLKEYKVVLNKMHIIEGEIIERLHLDDNLKGQRGKLGKVEDKGDVMVFPYTQEVWLDEIDSYKARVKDCPTLKGASL